MYGWFYYEKEGHYQGPYPTREDAVAAGRAMTDPERNFWVMEGKKPPFVFPEADQLLALFVEINGDLGTAAKPFDSDGVEITPAQKAHLAVAFRDLLGGWMDQYQIRFNIETFHTIQNVELVTSDNAENHVDEN
ncbi:hypothetical protein ADU59_27400 [Pararhizobium polonicum]|uniref:Uncharacterized protein n=1 Tax=Pararhizobium polonicum TaxID=1612624 RepID=A0A1C7NTB6_9HYPH|nr:hypothetical protein [Pararhizobium polonicum]OBZ92229.1 hypothetical protein ADU59_27400 [Pararhizobium polonicum]